MSNYCAVYGCLSKKSDKHLSFFHLPRDVNRRKKWIEAIGRTDLKETVKPASYILCSLHFDKSVTKQKLYLKDNAVPTISLPVFGSSTDYSGATTSTYFRTSTSGRERTEPTPTPIEHCKNAWTQTNQDKTKVMSVYVQTAPETESTATQTQAEPLNASKRKHTED